MGRVLGVIFLGVILCPPAWGRGPEPTPEAVLSKITSAGGGSLWARVQACHMKVLPKISHANVMISDSWTADVQKGDIAVELWVMLPPPLNQDVALLWKVRGSVATPQSGWADRIQNSRAISEMRC